MRALQKLVRNGQRDAGHDPARRCCINLGWLPGESVIIELLEDNTCRVSPSVR